MDLKLKGKKVLVTGGTYGIGRSIAECFAEEGCNVSICARDQRKVEKTVLSLSDKKIKAMGHAFDISNFEALERWIKESANVFEGIDIYISNVSAQSFDWNESFKIDIMGCVKGIETALPFLQTVYDQTHQKKLTRTSLADLLEKDPGFTAKGYPYQYFLQGSVVHFYPPQTAVTSVRVVYTPQPILLTEQTEDQDIPYPIAYHPVLVDGGLYYVFQEEGGFKNPQKAVEAQKRWEDGRSRLISSLYNTSGETFTTFMNV